LHHRDIKPENILACSTEWPLNVKLTVRLQRRPHALVRRPFGQLAGERVVGSPGTSCDASFGTRLTGSVPIGFSALVHVLAAPLPPPLCAAQDFGLSNFIDGDSSCHDNALLSHVGTSYYISPEILGKKGYGPPVDLWACGVVLYIMLCGRFPFFGKTDVEYVQSLHRGPNMTGPDWDAVSETGRAFLTALLSLDPKRRLSAAAALDHDWMLEGSDALQKNLSTPQLMGSVDYAAAAAADGTVAPVATVGRRAAAVRRAPPPPSPPPPGAPPARGVPPNGALPAGGPPRPPPAGRVGGAKAAAAAAAVSPTGVAPAPAADGMEEVAAGTAALSV